MIRDKEAKARLKINEMLKEAGWVLLDRQNKEHANVEVELNVKIDKDLGDDFEKTKDGFVDYTLLDQASKPLAVLEAKSERKSPLDGKEQARRYADNLRVRFVILSNGNAHYFWDIETGNPEIIRKFPSQQSLQSRKGYQPKPANLHNQIVEEDYIALSQEPSLVDNKRWKTDRNYRQSLLLERPNLRLLRPYQLKAIKALQAAAKKDKKRFLFEMATGTGKTLLSATVIKLFLKSNNAKRVLFLVDRLELEDQAYKNLKDYLQKDYASVIYKQNKDDCLKADIVISTVQSLLYNYKYKRFSPVDFDLLISDEAHRSMSGDSRAVFEYFIGYKLGLTATPKDYLKNIDKDTLSEKDQRSYERRLLLDTYTTFGCQSSEPTFRYSIDNGVADDYLTKMFAIDTRTEITTKLLSEKGYAQKIQDNQKNLQDVIYYGKDFEKKFFSEKTNIAFCQSFLEEAQKDPINKEIGKSLIFCVSQKHAQKITEILNQLAHKYWSNMYNSDFAVQVTSNVNDAQDFAKQFANNNLNGSSRFLEGYKTSKTRVCVTVNMMTTGYDCQDVLNLCLMRPIFSPTDFVQIRGRGTRKHIFKHIDERKRSYEKEKENFHLFDFFANCEYFEEKFDYDKSLTLVSTGSSLSQLEQIVDINEKLEIYDLDRVKTTKSLQYPKGMKIDREMWGKFQQKVKKDDDLRVYVEERQFEEAEYIVKTRYEDKPKYFLNLKKIQEIEGLDRRLSWREVLQYIFDLIERFPVRAEIIKEEIDKFISIYKPDDFNIVFVENFMYAYITDNKFRDIIDNSKYAELNHYPGFDVNDFQSMDARWRSKIPKYVKDYVNLNMFMS